MPSLELDPEAESVGRARRFTAGLLDDHIDQMRRADIVLCVSELVTNAVLHAGTACVLTVVVTGPHVRLAVRDSGAALPAPREPEINGGRGLRILAQIARDWGVEPHPLGKTVWAEL
jgi:anti-sigma regulatory factor (Ser/Thr protein kinase)